MLDAESVTSALANAVINAANSHHPAAAGFFEAIDRMLAWRPQLRANNGLQTDFARKARMTIDMMERHIDAAVLRFLDLQAALKGGSPTCQPRRLQWSRKHRRSDGNGRRPSGSSQATGVWGALAVFSARGPPATRGMGGLWLSEIC